MRRIVEQPFPQDPLLREPSDLAAAIRAARTRAGLTLVDAAASLGIAKQTLNDLERGKPTVALGTALRVATELGVSLFMAPADLRERVRDAVRAVHE
jgi:transcriptional regulator with XRE-family HTH domain